jgi:hypothetical protein
MKHVSFPCYQVKIAGQIIEQTNNSKDAESAMIGITKPIELFEIYSNGSAKLIKRIK